MRNQIQQPRESICKLYGCIYSGRAHAQVGWHLKEYRRKEFPQHPSIEKMFPFNWLVMGAFIMAGVEGPSILWVESPSYGGPGVYKKANWTSQWEQARKQCYPMASVSAPDSRWLLWVLPRFPLMKHSEHRLFFPQLLLVRRHLITVTENRRNSISMGCSENLTISLFWMSIKLEMICYSYFHLCSCYIAQLSVT